MEIWFTRNTGDEISNQSNDYFRIMNKDVELSNFIKIG